jgi:hypothetical protein
MTVGGIGSCASHTAHHVACALVCHAASSFPVLIALANPVNVLFGISDAHHAVLVGETHAGFSDRVSVCLVYDDRAVMGNPRWHAFAGSELIYVCMEHASETVVFRWPRAFKTFGIAYKYLINA